MGGGKCGLSAEHSWNDALRPRDTCRIRRRRRIMTNATEAPASAVAADRAATKRPISRRPPPPPPLPATSAIRSSRVFVCWGRPADKKRPTEFNETRISRRGTWRTRLSASHGPRFGIYLFIRLCYLFVHKPIWTGFRLGLSNSTGNPRMSLRKRPDDIWASTVCFSPPRR